MDTDATVIGAGVVGLATAARLSAHCRSVCLLERHNTFGQEISSRNSEVIHAGLYYPRGSLMARLCVEGNRLLYSECDRARVPFRRLGKLVVATNADEVPLVADLHRRALENGVGDVQILSRREVIDLEPHVRARCALLSPSSGIMDTHALMQHLEKKARQNGVVFGYGASVIGIRKASPGYIVTARYGEAVEQHTTRLLVNCAGLEADTIAGLLGGDPEPAGYRQYFCKGDYFSGSSRASAMLSRLVYPVRQPGAPDLGIHATLDMANRLRFGPDAYYIDRDEVNYAVDGAKLDLFLESARRFLPWLQREDLEPSFAGIRPKLGPPGTPQRDFLIVHELERGLPGVVNLLGIESPGLTACLAIARRVHGLLIRDGLLPPVSDTMDAA